MSGVTTVETVPSLALSGPLPELTAMMPPTSMAAPLREAVAEWTASWDEPEGDAMRVRARAVAVRHLVEDLDAGDVEEALRPLAWIESEIGDVAALPAALAVPVQEARMLTQASSEARVRGDLEDALELGLAAADRYRSITPEAVARRMVTRAERRVEEGVAAREDGDALTLEGHSAPRVTRSPGDGGAVEPDARDGAALDRAVHLANGARRALREGDHALAIQRAFYAIQVLDGRMDDPDH
jgi:hypothetical protein